MKISGKKILITGGATGIGFGLAERFMQENNSVIICGRRETALEEASRKLPGIITKKCDLNLEAERKELFKWISLHHNDLNVLVNNAGIQQRISIDDIDFYKKAKEEIQINIEAPVHLTSLFLNLVSLDTIINVSSGLGFVPMSRVAVYSATKAFIRSYTLSLRVLLKPRNIEVIEIIPPSVNTDLGGKGFHDQATPVIDFINAIFSQLDEGKQELTFGFTEAILRGNPDELKKTFERMNG